MVDEVFPFGLGKLPFSDFRSSCVRPGIAGGCSRGAVNSYSLQACVYTQRVLKVNALLECTCRLIPYSIFRVPSLMLMGSQVQAQNRITNWYGAFSVEPQLRP